MILSPLRGLPFPLIYPGLTHWANEFRRFAAAIKGIRISRASSVAAREAQVGVIQITDRAECIY